ncbi:chemotaxis response regulator protein-glutamate methylesterase [Desulfosarcina cetonica]
MEEGLHSFACCHCNETLVVSRPSLRGGCHAFADLSAKGDTATSGGDRPISILIVDDSTVLRKVLKEIFSADEQLKVVGEAQNGLQALELLPQLKPDVVTLDVNMPVMDGLTAIKHIMIKCPTPVVMFSTLTGQGSQETFEALRYGAVDFLQKPSSLLTEDLKSQHDLIISRVKNAARAGIDTIRYLRLAQQDQRPMPANGATCQHVFAIGSNYGSYGALLGLVPELDPQTPAAYVAVLYATPLHVEAFVHYLDKYSPIRVNRATDGQILHGGVCYLTSVFERTTIQSTADGLRMLVLPNSSAADQASDQLMTSLAMAMGERSTGILLSGIGDDGVDGSGQILSAGGRVILQDPKTCLCSETATRAARKYDLPTVLPGARMADTIRSCCLESFQ